MASLIEVIERKRDKIKGLTNEINKIPRSVAGIKLRCELREDRYKLYCELGRLVANLGVKICLQSEYTR